jgi:hypothetical protein
MGAFNMDNQLKFTYRLPIHPDEPTNSPCGQFFGYHSYSDSASTPALSLTIALGVADTDVIAMLEQIIEAVKDCNDIPSFYDFFAEGK